MSLFKSNPLKPFRPRWYYLIAALLCISLPGSILAASLRQGQSNSIGNAQTSFATAAAARPVIQAPAPLNYGPLGQVRPVGTKDAGYSTATLNGRLGLGRSQLFRTPGSPNAGYLIETDPAFTNQQQWLGSDYFLVQLNLDPERTLKRYGDGFAEQRLVDDQIMALTGKRYLWGYGSTQEAYQALMDSGALYAKTFEITPGIALSEQQMASLTSDIVWLERQQVTLADGSTTEALVPRVYLRKPQAGDLQATGSLVSGADITLRNKTGSLTNTGTLYANGNPNQGQGQLTLSANNLNNSGSLVGHQIDLTAKNDINNVGGSIQATDTLSARAGGNILLQTTTIDSSGVNSTRTQADRIATLQAGNIQLDAGKNIVLAGAQFNTDGKLTLKAGQDIKTVAVIETSSLNVAGSGNARGDYFNRSSSSNVQTNLGGNNVTAVAGRAITLTGANIAAMNDVTLVAKDITISAAVDSQTADQKGMTQGGYNRSAVSSQSLSGGNIVAGNNVTLVAQNTITVQAATLSADKGQTSLIAGGDIKVVGITTTRSSASDSASSSSGFLSSKSSSSSSASTLKQFNGSDISGSTVLIQSGQVGADGKLVKGTGDVSVVGSSVTADGDVLINSGNHVTLTGGQSSLNATSRQSSSQSGLSLSGTTLTLGSQSVDGNQSAQSTATTRALVGSLSGNVNINAEGTFTQRGADLLAAQDINVKANDIRLLSDLDITHSTNQTTAQQSGLSVGIGSGGTLGSVNNAINSVNTATTTSNGRAATLRTIAATRDLYDAGKAISAGGDPLKNASLNISIGASQSTSQSTGYSEVVQGATVAAGGNVNLQANTSTGVIATQGALIQGNNVSLSASQITLGAAQQTSTNQSSNNSSGWSAGVNVSVAGVSANASANRANGTANGTATENINTQVQARGTASLTSSGDTTLRGAVVSGTTVASSVGGNLNIESLQDTAAQAANQSSAGFGISVPITSGNFSASVNATNGQANGTYASVNQQSGIRAGSGGYQVNVAGSTTLTGGILASTALADKNTLTTATLSTQDIANTAAYSTNTSGGGLSLGKSGTLVPSLSVPQSDGGNQSSTTQSAISAGSITLTAGNPSANATQVAALNRDITRANPTPLVKLPDLSQTLSDQAQVSSATTAAGAAVFSTIGDIAQGRQQDAAARAQDAQQRLNANPTDPQAQADLAQANRDAAYWREGGPGKTILHGAGGLVLGGPGGASGAIANEQLLPTLIAGSKQMYPDPVPTGNKAADDKAWEEVNARRADYLKTGSLVVGVATGGTTGGSVAQTATQSNYLSHNPLNSRQSQLAAFSEQLSRCKSTPGCDVDAVYAYWSGVSREQQGQAQNAVVADFGSLGQLTPGIVGALGVNPTDFCASGDTRCYNFITANNGQAFSIIATANVLDGYGPSYSSGSVRPTGTGVATTNVRPGSGSGEIIGDLNANGSVTIRPASGAALTTGTGANGTSAVGTSTSLRVTNGVTLDPRLPDPVAGLGYQPAVLASANPNVANSQVNGYVSELNLANTVATLPNQQVISYAGPVGTHGADVVSVDVTTGQVTLWDSKFRSNPVPVLSSTTFAPGSSALNGALSDAEIDIAKSNLPQNIKQQAIQNLRSGDFNANTAGSGNAKNSTPIRFCGFKPC